MATINDFPVRLERHVFAKRTELPVKRNIPLPKPAPISTSFLLALAQRRSAEEFVPISLNDLSTWLYYCASVQAVHTTDPNRQRRFVSSFGALHPTHILLGDPDGHWFTYLARNHAMGELLVDAEMASSLRAKAMEFFKCVRGTLVALVSDGTLVAEYYGGASGQ